MLTIIKTVADMRAILSHKKDRAFVPTMGALHEGHLSLVKLALKHRTRIISIFINPTQFSEKEDFGDYPRTLQSDLDKLKTFNEDLIVFIPSIEELYIGHPSESTTIDIPKISQVYCGKTRPHFFKGVCSIVLKLLMITSADVLYLGEKDFQQLQIIRRMAKDLFLPVSVCSGKIIRDSNGLALSSRNSYLSKNDCYQASIIYQALKNAVKLFNQNQSVKAIYHLVQSLLPSGQFKIDYLVIIESNTLKERKETAYENDRLMIAVYFKKIRLIDNITLQKTSKNSDLCVS